MIKSKVLSHVTLSMKCQSKSHDQGHMTKHKQKSCDDGFMQKVGFSLMI